MIAYQIQIKSSSKDTFWYASKIGEIFWTKDILLPEDGYYIIQETEEPERRRWIGVDDVTVLQKADISIKRIITINVNEVLPL